MVQAISIFNKLDHDLAPKIGVKYLMLIGILWLLVETNQHSTIPMKYRIPKLTLHNKIFTLE